MLPAFAALFYLGCTGDKNAGGDQTVFTRTDSLTENYLTLQDTLLHAWNTIIQNDNTKINAMEQLIDQLEKNNGFDQELVSSLRNRINTLKDLRFTQTSIGDPTVVEEYDFASSSIVSELTAQAESRPDIQEPQINQLISRIRLADQQVDRYRNTYDSIARQYNSFLELNRTHIEIINPMDKRPLFAASDTNSSH